MERRKNGDKPLFPEKDAVASVIGSLYTVATKYFEETAFVPQVVVDGRYSDGKISEIAFEKLSPEVASELADKIRSQRTFAWAHVEAYADKEDAAGSWVKLFADLAYSTKRP